MNNLREVIIYLSFYFKIMELITTFKIDKFDVELRRTENIPESSHFLEGYYLMVKERYLSINLKDLNNVYNGMYISQGLLDMPIGVSLLKINLEEKGAVYLKKDDTHVSIDCLRLTEQEASYYLAEIRKAVIYYNKEIKNNKTK